MNKLQELKNDKTFVIEAIKINEEAFKYATDEFKMTKKWFWF